MIDDLEREKEAGERVGGGAKWEDNDCYFSKQLCYSCGKDAPWQWGVLGGSAGVVVWTSLPRGDETGVEGDCLEPVGALASGFLAHFTRIIGQGG